MHLARRDQQTGAVDHPSGQLQGRRFEVGSGAEVEGEGEVLVLQVDPRNEGSGRLVVGPAHRRVVVLDTVADSYAGTGPDLQPAVADHGQPVDHLAQGGDQEVDRSAGDHRHPVGPLGQIGQHLDSAVHRPSLVGDLDDGAQHPVEIEQDHRAFGPGEGADDVAPLCPWS